MGIKRHTTNSQYPFQRYPNLIQGLVITFLDQFWVADITYIRLGKGFVYLAVVMNVFSHSLDQQLTLLALKRALQECKPVIHHSDQGLQYAVWECCQNMSRFLTDVYMHKRIHSSLGYLTSAELGRNLIRQNFPLEIK